MITVLLVDDERMSRQAVRMLLACESDVDIVGEAMNAGEALELAQKLTPNVVIMDVKMPGMDGVAAAAILKDSAPASAVVMLSLYDDAATRARSIDAVRRCPILPLRPRIKVAARAPRTETPNVSVQPRVVPLGSRRRQTRSTPSRSAARRTTSSLHISSLMQG